MRTLAILIVVTLPLMLARPSWGDDSVLGPGNPPPVSSATPKPGAASPPPDAPAMSKQGGGDTPTNRLRAVASALRTFCEASAPGGAVDEAGKSPTIEAVAFKTAAEDAQKVLCAEYCDSRGAKASHLNVCAFRREPLAAAAVLANSAAVGEVLGELRDKIEKYKRTAVTTSQKESPFRWLIVTRTELHSGIPGLSPDAAVDALVVALQGLAKLVADRAKREAIGWALDNLATDVCGGEVKKAWLPALCNLATAQRLSAYGAGAALIDAVRGAIQSDVVGWPAAAASLVAGKLYSAQLKVTTCESSSNECKALDEVRAATGRLVAAALAGDALSTSLAGFGESLSLANGRPTKRDQLTQVVACAAMVPDVIDRTARALPDSDDAAVTAEAALLVTATTRPCRPLLSSLGVKAPGESIKLLRWLIAWDATVQSTASAISVRVEAVRRAAETARVALAAAKKRLSGLPGDASEAVRVAALTDVAVAVSASTRSAVDAFQLVVDVCNIAKCKIEVGSLAPVAAAASQLVEASSAMLTRRWSLALTAIASFTEKYGASTEGKTLTRWVPTISAILTAKDGDAVASALEDVVAPVGSWRSKNEPGALTASITAHPGFGAGLEVRYGQYGVVRERGLPIYGQAPTLTFPIGFELAKGYASGSTPRAWFLSILDPAAFLAYDASRDGKLPAARLLTAVAPGFGVRFGIRDTPFSVLPYFVYRPGFRSTETGAFSTGADAFQLMVLLSVDVTLFDLSPLRRSK